MNKTLHLRKYLTLTTGTNSVKLTLKEVLRMAIKAHIDFKTYWSKNKNSKKKSRMVSRKTCRNNRCCCCIFKQG